MSFALIEYENVLDENYNMVKLVFKHLPLVLFVLLSRLQLASANRVAALTSRDGIL